MPTAKLTIVPVTLDPPTDQSSFQFSSQSPSDAICMVKIANAEITFFHGVEEHIIQIVMKELINR